MNGWFEILALDRLASGNNSISIQLNIIILNVNNKKIQ